MLMTRNIGSQMLYGGLEAEDSGRDRILHSSRQAGWCLGRILFVQYIFRRLQFGGVSVGRDRRQ